MGLLDTVDLGYQVQSFDGKVEGPRTSSGAVAVRPAQ
jgi:hypothetical protein